MGAVGIVLVFVLAVLGMPIAFSLFVVGFGGIFMLQGFSIANSVMTFVPLAAIMGADFATLSLFILVGSFALASGIAPDAYEVARRWLGRLPGGIGLTTIAASAAFAACSGSSLAGAATMGKMAIPEMKRYGYSNRVAAGTCAAGGLLATMIPPSGSMVIYGIASEESIGHLLIAGVFPGLLIALFFCAGLYILAKLNPAAAPLSPVSFTWKERLAGIPKMWGVVVIFATIFFGIFLGFFTSSEAAAFGAFVALVLLVVKCRGKAYRAIITACSECISLTVMILFLVLGAFVFSSFLIMSGLPKLLSDSVFGLGLVPIAIIVMMMLTYVILGTFLDGVAMMLITIPIYYPIVTSLGYDGLWFGVIVVMMLEIGMLTPPFGLAVYVINGVAPDIPLHDVFRGSLMFVGLELMVVVLLIVFPNIALWLPSMML